MAVLLGACLASAAGAGVHQFDAVMIYASNERAPMDRRLENIEYKLRQVFGFEYYKLVGRGSVSVSVPGSGSISLGGGYTLQVQALAAGKGRVTAEVVWQRGGQVLLRTRTHLGRSPTVLGGASHEKGKLIVTLTVN
jgi:hypothetical protein